MKFSNLQDLTGHESGAILFGNGDILICNWSSLDGIPRVGPFGGLIGIPERLTARRVAVPREVKIAMQQHEREQGARRVSQKGFRGWKVFSNILGRETVTVVVQDDWH